MPKTFQEPVEKNVTRKDIARLAGVSVSVVSRALNNSGYVKKESKEKILQIAQELGYAPNPVAMSLQQRRTHQILYYCSDLHNAFNTDIYIGMMQEASKRNYMVVLNGDINFEQIHETMVDGLILQNESHAEEYDRVCGKNYYLPTVSASYGKRPTLAHSIPFVEWDLYQAMEKAVSYLREKGHRKIAYLSAHPLVEKVNHPSLPDHPDHALYEKYFPNGGASIFTFEIKGGKEEAWKFIDALEIFSLLANVADVKSLVIHPASTTHSQLSAEELADQGIYQNTIRLSIGTEHIDDIIADLEKGFAAI